MFATEPAQPESPFHAGLAWSKLAPSALGLVLIAFLFTQWNEPSFSPSHEEPLLAVLAIEHSAANHIASVSGNRATDTPKTASLRNDAAILATTGMVSFPLLRTTNR